MCPREANPIVSAERFWPKLADLAEEYELERTRTSAPKLDSLIPCGAGLNGASGRKIDSQPALGG